MLSVAGALAAIASTVTLFGSSVYVTREVARSRDQGAALATAAIWIGLMLGSLAVPLLVLLGAVAGASPQLLLLIGVAALAVPSYNLLALGYGVIQGLEQMRYQGILDVFAKLLRLCSAIAVVVLGLQVVHVAAFASLAALLVAIPMATLLWRLRALRRPSPGIRDARALLSASLPFATVDVSRIIYQVTDPLLLAALAGSAAAGIYTPPMRLVGTMLFIATVATTVTFPRLSASFKSDPVSFRKLASSTLRIVLAVSIPLAIVSAGASGDAARILLGERFADSGPVLGVLVFVSIPMGVSIVLNRVLVACGRERAWTRIVLLAFPFKILLALALIPLARALLSNPALGAALALLVAETAIVPAALAQLPRDVRQEIRSAIPARMLLSGAISVATLSAAAAWGPSVPGQAAVAGGATYAVCAALLRVHTWGELRSAAAWGLRGRSPGEGALAPAEQWAGQRR
jgi:O-antigen/teichoic acid export membrane protein